VRYATDAERLAALERLLSDVQFAHPSRRAELVDEFYAAERAADRDALRLMHDRVRKALLYALERRAEWVKLPGPVNVARAVAYQSLAGRLQRILDAAPSEDGNGA
jgi:hypothetical protein